MSAADVFGPNTWVVTHLFVHPPIPPTNRLRVVWHRSSKFRLYIQNKPQLLNPLLCATGKLHYLLLLGAFEFP